MIRRNEIEVTVRKLKTIKAVGKDEVIGTMIKGGGWWIRSGGCVIWNLSDDGPED